ncbi:DNA-formamidopyrimidine glycosylase [Thalassorhabdus alkalitolerans]|uniref:Formamidopyrimidine-DNA glycosylase n=1 Tax=Thalassorhabdus alkalitolerans TaxID=2282697 RepID=A0ABW0YNN5_9BACI
MPELPEVETVKETLTQLIKGKEIKEVTITWPKIIKRPDDQEAFRTLIHGQTIHEITRRGKFLKFHLDDLVLVSHLRMEGRYEMSDGQEADKHTHVRFLFTDGTELRYRDVRKFGTMHLFEKGTEETALPLAQLGPEPLTPEFTPEVLKRAFEKTTRNVKAVLLDQKAVAGLGNIYVDEALFKAGIRPNAKASTLHHEELVRLHQTIVETLQEAVDKGGSSVRSYVNSKGDMGMFQLHLYVYGRQGEECRNCMTPIEKLVVAGRGTHFCPGCQPEK